MDNLVKSTLELRTRLMNDPHRPRYHFVTPEGVCRPFDPNGAIFWQGRYHLFYIFQNPDLPHSGHCWGHASSIDLLHWTHHPTALVPGAEDPEKGIFSGCALVNKEGVPTLVYLGVDSGICVANSVDENLIEWKKSPHNPVIPIPREGDPGFGEYIVHDPHVWLEGDTYYAVLNGRSQWDTLHLFKSSDLTNWEYLHPFYEPKSEWTETDEDCACPDFFSLGDKHMILCISHKLGCRYYLGRYQDEKFYPEDHQRMNWPGGSCFAPESSLDDGGRRIFWAWALDLPGPGAQSTEWSGTMTLPRVLSLDAGGDLVIEPASELENLRLNGRELGSIHLPADREIVIDKVRGDSLELTLEIEPQEAHELGLVVRRSPDGEEATVIAYVPEEKVLKIDFSKSSLDKSLKYPIVCVRPPQDDPGTVVQEAPFELGSGESLKLRLFLDRSILEVFANGRQCLTQRIYPTRDDSLGIALYSKGGDARVVVLNVWEMTAANPW